MRPPPSEEIVGGLGGRLFDHHIHCDARNADDYELLALAGVDNVLIPCSMSNERRSSADSFDARFDRLLRVEVDRAAHYGVRAWVALAVHVGDMTDLISALAGIDRLVDRLADRRVVALGEISLRQFSTAEITVFEAQLRLAEALSIPVMVELPPHLQGAERVSSVLRSCLRRGLVDPARVALMDVTEQMLPTALELGCGACSLAVCPPGDRLFQVRPKSGAEQVADCVRRFGHERLMLGSGLHFGSGEPLALPRIALRLRLAGMDAAVVDALVGKTAAAFFGVPLNPSVAPMPVQEMAHAAV